MIVKLNRNHVEELLKEARENYPTEACGILFGFINGEKLRIEKIVPLRNMLGSETMFRIDPEEFLRVLIEYEGKGLQHIGFFHSHPRHANPSSTDLKYMSLWPESLWIIVSHSEFRVAAYRIINGRIEEVNISVE